MLQEIFFMLCSSALISAGVIGTNYSPASSISYSSTPVVEKSFNTPTGYSKITQTPPVYQSVLTTKESNYESPDGSQHTAYTKTLNTAYSSLKKYESKSTKDGDILANEIPGIYSTAAHSPIVYHQGAAYSLSSPLTHSFVHTPILTKTVSIPISYATHDDHLSKTIVSPSTTSYSTPVLTKSQSVPVSYTTHDFPLTRTIVSPSLASYSTPALTKSVSTPVSYTTHDVPFTKTIVSPTIASHSTPVFDQTKYVTSGLTSYSSHTPVIESQPIKTTITYSQAPLVSHMSFSGLGASYAW